MPLGSLAMRFSLSKTATTGSGSRARRHRPLLHRPTALLSSSSIPGAFHLMIEAIQGNGIGTEQKKL